MFTSLFCKFHAEVHQTNIYQRNEQFIRIINYQICLIAVYTAIFHYLMFTSLNMLTSFKLLNGELNSDMNHTPNLDLKTRKIFIYIELRCMYIRLHVAQTHAHPIVAPLKKAY